MATLLFWTVFCPENLWKNVRLPLFTASWTLKSNACLFVRGCPGGLRRPRRRLSRRSVFAGRGSFRRGLDCSPCPALNDVGIATPCRPRFVFVPPNSCVSIASDVEPMNAACFLISSVFVWFTRTHGYARALNVFSWRSKRLKSFVSTLIFIRFVLSSSFASYHIGRAL